MKTYFLQNELIYNGSQLRPLFAYLEYQVLGDSIVSWQGPCDIPFEHMKDGEDLVEKAEIRGSRMLHFIIEIFQQNLFSAVSCQRLFAAIVCNYLQNTAGGKLRGEVLRRQGDDIYLREKKLSISIASISSVSVQIHFALNISNEGTPVPTASLEDLGLEGQKVANDLMELWKNEFNSIVMATKKVRPL